MRRGEVWLAHARGRQRPVPVLTRSEEIDGRRFVTVAKITTSVRGLGSEVALDPVAAGLDIASVVNCDGIHTVDQAELRGPVGTVDPDTMRAVCAATNHALGC